MHVKAKYGERYTSEASEKGRRREREREVTVGEEI
jgi:hypothetical protein